MPSPIKRTLLAMVQRMKLRMLSKRSRKTLTERKLSIGEIGTREDAESSGSVLDAEFECLADDCLRRICRC
jgi:hypothetical protein